MEVLNLDNLSDETKRKLQDFYWGELAKKAEEEGFLTPEESTKFISKKIKKQSSNSC